MARVLRYHSSPPLIPAFLIPTVATVENFDVGGSILEWRPLRLVPYLPHQAVLESEWSTVVEAPRLSPS